MIRCPQSLQRTRKSGSVVILVIVSLVLMAMMGAVYLQQTAVQRFAVAKVEGDIDVVVDACINHLMVALREDLTDTNTSISAGGVGGGLTSLSGLIELYDYPHTNADPSTRHAIMTFFKGQQTAHGGDEDDMWLASQMPDFSGGPGLEHWPHISNLWGYYVDDGDTDPSELAGVGTDPAVNLNEHVVNFANTTTQTDTDLLLGPAGNPNRLLVDADGDGIGDSRWAWAAIRQISGVMYFMAVRVVDLSGMINTNTALSQIDSTGQYDPSLTGDNAPYWHTPSEIDLGQFVFSLRSGAMDELRKLLLYRTPYGLIGQTLVSGPNRDDFWTKQGSIYLPRNSGGFQAYGIDDEYELRYRNGLNLASNVAAIEDPTTGMNLFLRSPSPAEGDYMSKNWAGEYPGGSSSGDFRQDFFELEPRHQMTTTSGTAIFAPKLTNADAFDGSFQKLDVNTIDGDALAEEIETTFDTAENLPGGLISVIDFADQFAASIKDYADADNKVTQVGNYYGMEALPMLIEVYAQRPYTISLATDNDVDGNGAPSPPDTGQVNTWTVRWTPDDNGTPGYAIEIGNPFNRPISLEGVRLIVGGNDWGDLATMWGAPANVDADLDGTVESTGLNPGQTLILYRDSESSNGSHDDVTSLFTDTTNVASVSGDWPVGGSSNVNVELVAVAQDDSTGNTPAYSRIQNKQFIDSFDDDIYPATSLFNSPAMNPVSANVIGYIRHFSIGNGNGLNMLTVDEDEIAASATSTFEHGLTYGLPGSGADPAPEPAYDEDAEALGQSDKTIKGGPSGDIPNPSAQQIIIGDRGSILQIGELAHVAALGFDATETIPKAWSNSGATNVSEFQLDFSGVYDTGTIGAGGNAVPHGAMLLDRLTTLDPMSDGEDNDGDGESDNFDHEKNELIIPGLINLNTIPSTLLERILPIADPELRHLVAQAVVDYRDNPEQRSVPFRLARPGIASVGELFSGATQLYDLYDLAHNPADENALEDGGGNNITVDFLGNDTSTQPPYTDGVNDREEEMLIASWLSQVGSVRSDTFAAYLLVHGYDASDFSGGPIESKRVIAVFRRNAEENEHQQGAEVTVEVLVPSNAASNVSWYEVN